MSKLPWYNDGLRFECTECGKCCTGSPGYVWIDEQEMLSMAKTLNISLDVFKRTYTRRRFNRYALTEKKSQGNACIFLEGNKCSIYTARPKQCRTFPFWQENLNTPESWRLAAQSCEGIRANAPIVPLERIEEQLKRNTETI